MTIDKQSREESSSVTSIESARRILAIGPPTTVEGVVVRDWSWSDSTIPYEVWIGPFIDDWMGNRIARERAIQSPNAFGFTRLLPDQCGALAIEAGFETLESLMRYWDWNEISEFWGAIARWKEQGEAVILNIGPEAARHE